MVQLRVEAESTFLFCGLLARPARRTSASSVCTHTVLVLTQCQAQHKPSVREPMGLLHANEVGIHNHAGSRASGLLTSPFQAFETGAAFQFGDRVVRVLQTAARRQVCPYSLQPQATKRAG